MKRIVSIVLILLCVGVSYAQKDKQAKDILDKASAAFSKAGGMSAGFTLNIKDVKAKVTESFDGQIHMKGDKFYLTVPEYDLWFNGTTQWLYMKGNEEVNVSEPSKEEVQMLNPSVLFNLYKHGYGYKYLGEKADIKGKQVYEVELMPNKKSDILKMTIQIGKLSSLPHYILITYKNNIQNILYINQYETGKKYSDTYFSFDKKKYPGVEVIDLRD